MKTQQSIRFLSLIAIILLQAACSRGRYTSVPRSHATKSQTSTHVAQAPSQAQNNTEVLINTPKTDLDENNQKPNTIDKSTKQVSKLSHPLIVLPPDTLPDDSIEIDIVHETIIAEEYGKKGYIIGMISLISLIIFPLISLMSVAGLIYSVIAYRKMITYDLPVKNRRRIEYGLIINAAILLSFIAIIGLLFLIFW